MKLYYYEGSERKGPIVSTQLRQLAAQGKIQPTTILENEHGLKVSADRASVVAPGLSLNKEFQLSGATSTNSVETPKATPKETMSVKPFTAPSQPSSEIRLDLGDSSIKLDSTSLQLDSFDALTSTPESNKPNYASLTEDTTSYDLTSLDDATLNSSFLELPPSEPDFLLLETRELEQTPSSKTSREEYTYDQEQFDAIRSKIDGSKSESPIYSIAEPKAESKVETRPPTRPTFKPIEEPRRASESSGRSRDRLAEFKAIHAEYEQEFYERVDRNASARRSRETTSGNVEPERVAFARSNHVSQEQPSAKEQVNAQDSNAGNGKTSPNGCSCLMVLVAFWLLMMAYENGNIEHPFFFFVVIAAPVYLFSQKIISLFKTSSSNATQTTNAASSVQKIDSSTGSNVQKQGPECGCVIILILIIIIFFVLSI